MTSTLVVIEGASGVGKSTLVRELLTRNSQWLGVPSLNFPRERDKALEVSGNSGSDYLCLATAMSHANATVIADRGFLGHWVYEAIKEGPRDCWREHMVESIKHLEDTFHYELSMRWRDTPFIVERPNIKMIVLMPSEGQLEFQRITAKKEYPYNELKLYGQMASKLLNYRNEVYLQVSMLTWPLPVETVESLVQSY